MLKLTALDADDLAVISAQMQDAVIRAGDIKYLKRAGKLAILANRFAWDEADGVSGGRLYRRRTGLQLAAGPRGAGASHPAGQSRCRPVAARHFLRARTKSPRAAYASIFQAAAGSRPRVECIEAALEDLGPGWETAHMPSHEAG